MLKLRVSPRHNTVVAVRIFKLGLIAASNTLNFNVSINELPLLFFTVRIAKWVPALAKLILGFCRLELAGVPVGKAHE